MSGMMRTMSKKYGMQLPVAFEGDEQMLRAVITDRARSAGHSVADDAVLEVRRVGGLPALGNYDATLLVNIEVEPEPA